jgi:hypothetical protein
MNHSSASTVSLALCTFANIASEEMARDLVTEIERCLGSGNAYIRKKAALAALRCLYKDPDLVDHFEGRAMSLLSDRNHGVLLTGVTLVTEMVRLVGGDNFRKVRSPLFLSALLGTQHSSLPGRPPSRPASQGSRHYQLLPRTRCQRHHRSLPSSQGPPVASYAREGRYGSERGDE